MPPPSDIESNFATPATELFESDNVAERTYSSLPPSPRTEASAEFGLDRSLDLTDLHTQFKKSSSPRRRRSFVHETEDEGVEEFWPALSRRQTLDIGGERPTFLSGSVPPPLQVQTEAPESPDVGEEPLSPLSQDLETPLDSPGMEPSRRPTFRETAGLSLWELLKDEDAAEHWEGWIADGKWYVLWEAWRNHGIHD